MNKLQLTNLSSNNQFDVINQKQQKNIKGGDRFNDGKLDSGELEFISIVTRAIDTNPEYYGPRFSDPEWNQRIQEKYPDIYKAFIPS